MGKIFLAYFLSGAVGLAYQILWARTMSQIFGASVYGQALSISLFMGGIALGSFLGGKKYGSCKNPLRFYGLVEGVIGVFGILSIFMDDICKAVFTGNGGVDILLAIILCAVLILPATTLMGITFPVLFKGLKERGEAHYQNLSFVSFLYVANALGALLGILWSGFYSIEFFGMNETFCISAGVNFMLMFLFLGEKPHTVAVSQDVSTAAYHGKVTDTHKRMMLWFLAISGFNTMSYEVAWSRLLHFSFGSSTYSFSLILFAFIFGLTLGARYEKKSIVKAHKDAAKSRLGKYQLYVLIGSIVFMFIVLRLPLVFDLILQWSGGNFLMFALMEATLLTVLLLPTTFPIGASFPLMCELYMADSPDQVKDLGKAYAANTLGAIVGAMLTGFVLIPWIGPANSIWINAVGQLFITVCLVRKDSFKLRRTAVIVGILVVFLYINFRNFNASDLLLGPYTRYYGREDLSLSMPLHLRKIKAYWVAKEKREKEIPGERQLLWMKHGVFSTVAVTQDNKTRQLVIDGKTDASVGPYYLSDLPTQTLLAILPLCYTPSWEEILVIGLGSGMTASILSDFGKHLDCVELEEKVFQAAHFFKNYNYLFWQKKHVNMHITDARRFVSQVQKKYDIISSEPSNLWVAGVASLFTREFFERGSRILKDSGVFIQWIHTYKLSLHDFQTVINTFGSVFPVVELWGSLNVSDFFLIGLKNNDSQFDMSALLKKTHASRFATSLQDMQFDLPDRMIDYRLMDRIDFNTVKNKLHSEIHTDNKPILEFSAARHMYTFEVGEIYNFLGKIPDDQKN